MAQLILQKRGERIIGARGIKNAIRKSTESTNMDSQRLTEIKPTTSEPAWD